MAQFQGKKLALCCNKTLAGAPVDITSIDDFTKWVGHSVNLTSVRIDRERMTITPAPANSCSSQQAPAAPAASAAGVDGEESDRERSAYDDSASESQSDGVQSADTGS